METIESKEMIKYRNLISNEHQNKIFSLIYSMFKDVCYKSSFDDIGRTQFNQSCCLIEFVLVCTEGFSVWLMNMIRHTDMIPERVLQTTFITLIKKLLKKNCRK